MNKPQGILLNRRYTRQDSHRFTQSEYRHFQPFPVGDWIKIPEGFYCFQTMGNYHDLLSPKKNVPKTYYAHVSGVVTEKDIESFKDGVMLDDGYVTKPGKLHIIKIC